VAFLELKGVAKGFTGAAGRVEVLREVNLEVERGEFVAVVGYSGAGKTTLLSMIAGLTRPDEGSVLLDGQPVREPGPDRGVVFQNYSLLPWLTVAENIALGVDQVFADWPAARRKEHVDRYIALVNLTNARDKRPGQLSGGMRQRVSVARALALNPAVLLLDEPLGALDALTRATLQDELEAIWERDQKTVLLVTNDVDEAVRLADRIVPMTVGPAATLGPPIPVRLPRLNHDPAFKATRGKVIEYLLGPARRRGLLAAVPTPVAAPPAEKVSA
jgi:nitrate/nitrite transport system ATP-binding protein